MRKNKGFEVRSFIIKMDLEVAVPTQSNFKKRRKDNLNSELNAESFQCDEESFHILAGIISLNVINQVITSYQKPAMDRIDHPNEPGLPDSDTLSKIKMLWQQNLSKVPNITLLALIYYGYNKLR